MKRSDMVLKLMEILVEAPEDVEAAAEYILNKLEDLKMKPPAVDNDRCQALMHVYMYPCFYVWDEQFSEDEKVVEAYEQRIKK